MNINRLFLSAATLATITLLASCSSRRHTIAPQSSSEATDTLVVMSYNVENLFDPADNPEKNDDDFTPEGSYHWTDFRLRKKAAALGQVILAANGLHTPDVIGLCEVEGPDSTGLSAADLLVRYANLPYTPVCFPTPDHRGIATALLFNPMTVEPVALTHVSTSSDSLDLHTRDILYAKMKTLRGNAIFHILVTTGPLNMAVLNVPFPFASTSPNAHATSATPSSPPTPPRASSSSAISTTSRPNPR